VIGTDRACSTSSAVHNSRPVFVSNARNNLSLVAPMKINPPAVVIGPP
jgi:hypothetical protein